MKKIIAMLLVIINLFSFTAIYAATDTTKPSIMIQGPTSSSVNAGGSLSYTVSYSDNSGAVNVYLNSSNVRLYGFTASISVSGNGSKRTVTLSNIRGTSGSGKYIGLSAGTAKDGSGNESYGVTQSRSFSINNPAPVTPAPTPAPTPVPVAPTPAPAAPVAPTPAKPAVSKPVAPATNNTNITNNETPKVEENKPEENKDETKPQIKFNLSSVNIVEKNGKYSLVIEFVDDDENLKIELTKEKIAMTGFTANVEITGEGKTRRVEFSNIAVLDNAKKSIKVQEGVATDSKGNTSDAVEQTLDFEVKKEKYDDGRPDDWVENPNTGK